MESENSMPYILIIEDNEIDALIMEMQIKDVNPKFNFVKKTDGRKGFNFLAETDLSVNPPVFILLNIGMPLFDGLQFMEIYNENLYAKAPSIPVYVITSSINQIDIDTSLSYPFVKRYINKPLIEVNIREILDDIGETV